MDIRWLWGDYIEPEWKLSRAEARAVHRIVKERHVSWMQLLGLTGVWLVIVFIAVRVLHMPLAGWLESVVGIRYPLSWLVSMVAVLLPLMIVAMWTFRWVYTRAVRLAMRDLGYDVCPNCGYWLRGLDDDVQQCPECGAKRA